jgi:hypothetical protein
MAQDDGQTAEGTILERVAALEKQARDDERELLRAVPPAVAMPARAGVAELRASIAAWGGVYEALLAIPADEVDKGVEAPWRAARARAQDLRSAAYRLMAVIDRPDTGPAPSYKPGSNSHLETLVDHYGYEGTLLRDEVASLDDADAYKAALPAISALWG